MKHTNCVMQTQGFVSCAPQMSNARLLLDNESLHTLVLQPRRDLKTALAGADDYDLITC